MSTTTTASAPSRRYGWKRGVHRHDDPIHCFAPSRVSAVGITKVDLRPFMPPVYDQGELGSCTANAIAAAYQFDEIKEKEVSIFMPSRMFIYYGERTIEDTINDDAGAIIADGMKVIHTVGVCPEQPVASMPVGCSWPYDPSKFDQRPPQACFDVAKNHKSITYRRVMQNTDQLRQALIAGFPVVFGFTVFASFESDAVAKTGNMPMPTPKEENMGGHAVLMCGFDDSKVIGNQTGAFLVRNSWGPTWGEGGYFWMPYAYAVNPDTANDFWTLTLVRDS